MRNSTVFALTGITTALLTASIAQIAINDLNRQITIKDGAIEYYSSPIPSNIVEDAQTLCERHGKMLRMTRLETKNQWDVQCKDTAVFQKVILRGQNEKVNSIATRDIING